MARDAYYLLKAMTDDYRMPIHPNPPNNSELCKEDNFVIELRGPLRNRALILDTSIMGTYQMLILFLYKQKDSIYWLIFMQYYTDERRWIPFNETLFESLPNI